MDKISEIKKLAIFLKSISDENRLKIIFLLQKSPRCVCEIFPALRISQKLASHHLGHLQKVGLVSEKREGCFIRHSLNKNKLKEYTRLLNKLIR